MKSHFQLQRIVVAGVLSMTLVCRAAVGQDAASEAHPAGGTDPHDAPAGPSDDEVATWIAELDSNRYLVRERATQKLLSSGIAAVGPLLSAANGTRPEPADRAIWALRQMAESTDATLRRAALEHLVQVEGRPQVVAEAQSALATIEHDLAVLAIEQLGGRFLEDGLDPNWGQQEPIRRVVLDDQWRGGDEGLAHLAKLRNVTLVIIMGSDVTGPGVKQLAALESLNDLWLYGTRLEDRDVAELEKQMPGVKIDYRRGALLGVRGNDVQGAAVVAAVQPGTAAAEAGIQTRDVVRKFNGEPVANFQDLTGKIAKCVPGDRVVLEIVRGGQAIDVEVTLGRWKSR